MKLITPDDAAKLLGRHRRSVGTYLERGLLTRFYNAEGYLRLDVAEVVALKTRMPKRGKPPVNDGQNAAK